MTEFETRDALDTRLAGTIGVVVAVLLAVILGVHPFGTTELYEDGVRFTEHVDLFWVVIHLAAAALLLLVPLVMRGWEASLSNIRARTWGRLATMLTVAGTAIGVLHLAGTDTLTFLGFQSTLASGSSGAEVGTQILLRIHAATLTGWIVLFFMGVPLAASLAVFADNEKRRWIGWLMGAGGLLAAVSVVLTFSATTYTTLSETVVFRTSATIFIVWLLFESWQMRRTKTLVA